MKESVTYQEILNEGRAEGRAQEARNLLVKLGEQHFKQSPNSETRATLEAIEDPERLGQMVLRVYDNKSWDELVPLVPKPSRSRKKKA